MALHPTVKGAWLLACKLKCEPNHARHVARNLTACGARHFDAPQSAMRHARIQAGPFTTPGAPICPHGSKAVRVSARDDQGQNHTAIGHLSITLQ